METFPAVLRRRVDRNGAGPLITFYDDGTGERTELSGTSFANWVDKTANLALEEFGIEPGAEIALPLLDSHPGHWVSLVWVAACWQLRAVARATVTTGVSTPTDRVELEVTGPDGVDRPAGPAPRVACSLHPLGLGFDTTLPDGVLDYAEVRVQPDVYLGEPARPDDPAWVDDGQRSGQRELVASDGSGDRVLVVPSTPWQTVRDALVRPVLGGGSAVVVVGADPARIAHLAATERVTG